MFTYNHGPNDGGYGPDDGDGPIIPGNSEEGTYGLGPNDQTCGPDDRT
jgi:hypothetical protein